VAGDEALLGRSARLASSDHEEVIRELVLRFHGSRRSTKVFVDFVLPLA